MTKEKIVDEGTLESIRDFTVRGLAEAVPEFLTVEKAADIICLWFPADKLALEALYRRVAAKK